MKKKISVLLTLITACLCIGSYAMAEEQNVIHVNNIGDLINNIASNTKIVISEGNYIAPRMYDEYDMDCGIVIKDIENLTIEGEGKVEIKLSTGFAPVFDIWNSRNITIKGLSLGHDVPEFDCMGEGDVILVHNESDDVYIDNCDLWGCGIYGVVGSYCGDITVTNTVIRDCEQGAAVFWDVNGIVTFENCEFWRNTYIVREENNADIFEYTTCISSRTFGNATTKIIVKNSLFKNNYSAKCYDMENGTIEFYNCTHENNPWGSIPNSEENPIHVGVAESGETEYSDIDFPDQKPTIVDGRTLVPVRGLFEHFFFGCTVEWDDATKTAIISNGTDTIKIPIGVNVIYKNDIAITIDVPAQIINDRTMLPLRAIAEAFDLNVEWDEETRTVLINKK